MLVFIAAICTLLVAGLFTEPIAAKFTGPEKKIDAKPEDYGTGWKVTAKEIRRCPSCNNYTGWVNEKDNGRIRVHCVCSLEEELAKYGHLQSPCMVSPNGDKFWFTPTTDHRNPNGVVSHAAYFLWGSMAPMHHKE